MAHTFDIVCYDANGNIGLMAILDDDSQGDDPAFTVPNMAQLKVPAVDLTNGIVSGFIQAAANLGVTIQQD